MAGLGLAALAVVIYGPHVINGGWYVDDWILIAQLKETSGYFEALRTLNEEIYRPGYTVWFALFYEIVGDGQSPYLAIGLLISAVQAWLFYLVLRSLGLQGAVAALAAALFLVLPYIDTTRLWLTIFQIPIAGSFYLGGVLAALYGFRCRSRTRAIACHGASVACYLWAMLTYEAIIGLIAATVLLYRSAVPWPRAGRRAAVDFGAIALVLLVIVERASQARGATVSLDFVWDRAVQMLGAAETVLRAFPPWREVLGGPVGIALVAAGFMGAGVLIGRRATVASGLVHWSRVALVSAVFALAGLVMYLPADPYFVPRLTGFGNRTGALAGLGAVMLFVAVVVIAAVGLAGWFRRPGVGAVLAAVALVATLAAFVIREHRQQVAWADAWIEQQGVVASVGHALGGDVPPEATIVTFGHTTVIEPDGVSVFHNAWDLRGALWETYGDDLAAHAWVDGARCDAGGVWFPHLGSSEAIDGGPFAYRKRLFFVDVSRRLALPVTDQATCNELAAQLPRL